MASLQSSAGSMKTVCFRRFRLYGHFLEYAFLGPLP